MKITEELQERLYNYIGSKFQHCGETFELVSYGGSERDMSYAYAYWESEDTNKMIKMEYILRKIGHDRYGGIDRILMIRLWGDYDKGTVIDEITF